MSPDPPPLMENSIKKCWFLTLPFKMTVSHATLILTFSLWTLVWGNVTWCPRLGCWACHKGNHGQHGVIRLVEDLPGQGRELGENVPGGGRVLATGQTSPELVIRKQDVDIVGPDVFLSQAYDGAHQGGLAVVVGRDLCNTAGQLGHLDLFLCLVPLKTCLLTRPSSDRPDFNPSIKLGVGPLIVHVAEQDQLLVDEVSVVESLSVLLT